MAFDGVLLWRLTISNSEYVLLSSHYAERFINGERLYVGMITDTKYLMVSFIFDLIRPTRTSTYLY